MKLDLDDSSQNKTRHKRKITDQFNVDSRKKLSKTERIESNYKEALEEQHGLEKSLVNSYVSDSVSLELAKLSVSDKLYLPLNRSKTREIKDSMEDQFDPILATLYVIPKDLKRYEGGEDLETIEFEVVCGQHKFHAMKEIIHEGKRDKLIGVVKGKLPCYTYMQDWVTFSGQLCQYSQQRHSQQVQPARWY